MTSKGLGVALSLAVVGACGSAGDAPLGPGSERLYADHREVDYRYRSTDGVLLTGTLYLPRATGRFPALVMHFGSDRWTRRPYATLSGWVGLGMAVLSYDKRGVGSSEGTCCPFAEPGYFPLLAQDVLAGVHAIQSNPEIRSDSVGLFGFSQGGWVVPVAAAEAPADVAFTIIGSGPAVTLGEELLYSSLTGEDHCQPTGLPADEIDRRLAAAGPSAFDPKPFLERMTRPGLWIYGGQDLSVPVGLSVRNLSAIRDQLGRDFTIVVVPELNHAWIPNGSICQVEGQDWDDGQVIVPWLRENLPP